MTVRAPEFGVVARSDVATLIAGDVQGTSTANFDEIWDFGELNCKDNFAGQLNEGF